MVEVRVVNEALLLKTNPVLSGAINTVLVMKGVRVSELFATQVRTAGARARRCREPLFALS